LVLSGDGIKLAIVDVETEAAAGFSNEEARRTNVRVAFSNKSLNKVVGDPFF
jgi:hypothetical protein